MSDDIKSSRVARDVLLVTLGATLVYFFGFAKLYSGESIMAWAWQHWLPRMNQEYCKLVIPISLGLVWYHRRALREALKKPSNAGLWLLGLGCLFVLVGVRALQPRLTMLSIPFLLAGGVMFIWGTVVARILMFPLAFLIFMIPVGALQQATFRLQFLITGAMQFLAPILALQLNAVGTTLTPVDGSWGFDIAEGCSGIRSLVAIVMLTAIYAHLAEKVWWKKVALLFFSIGFAIVANIGRIFTILLIARLGYPKIAGGIYHEYSGFISFPVALCAMIFVHKLLTWGSKVHRKEVPALNLSAREHVEYDY